MSPGCIRPRVHIAREGGRGRRCQPCDTRRRLSTYEGRREECIAVSEIWGSEERREGGREKVNPGRRRRGKPKEGEWEQFLPFSTSVKIRSSLTGLKVELHRVSPCMPSSEFRALVALLRCNDKLR